MANARCLRDLQCFFILGLNKAKRLFLLTRLRESHLKQLHLSKPQTGRVVLLNSSGGWTEGMLGNRQEESEHYLK